MQENILSKKLNLRLNLSTPSGGVTSPLLKESMVIGVGTADSWNIVRVRVRVRVKLYEWKFQ